MKTLVLAGLRAVMMRLVPEARAAASSGKALTAQQEAMVSIASFAAMGDMDRLNGALVQGLENGLTVSEIKEILVQLYAYAGFPRSLNALESFMAVLDLRQKQGIRDESGKEPGPFPPDRTSLAIGAENQTRLVGQEVKGPFYDFAPAIDQFLKAHLFGDIFRRDNLDWLSREIVTVSILASIAGLNPQLQGHFAIAMHNGLTPAQAREITHLLSDRVSPETGRNAAQVLDEALQAQAGQGAR